MKKSNKTLLTDVIEEVLATLDEGLGGGAGTFSYVQTAGAKTWAPKSPPFRRQTGTAVDYNIKDIADDDAVFAKTARLHKPFPLETINDHLVTSYIAACNAEVQIKNCLRYNVILATSKEKKALLSHLLNKVIGIKEMVKSVVEDLDRITIS